jgi:hypothetical protein
MAMTNPLFAQIESCDAASHSNGKPVFTKVDNDGMHRLRGPGFKSWCFDVLRERGRCVSLTTKL